MGRCSAPANTNGANRLGPVCKIVSMRHHLLRRCPVGCFERIHAFQFLVLRSDRNSIEEDDMGGNEQIVCANAVSPVRADCEESLESEEAA